jgi:hypothetical protein
MPRLRVAAVFICLLALANQLAGCGVLGASTQSQPTPPPARTATAAPFVFGPPVDLGPAINTPGFDGGPNVSADGLALYFITERDGGAGGGDLWRATRPDAGAPFAAPVNLGPVVNGRGDEGAPSISHDGLSLYFDADPSRPGGQGQGDIWLTTRSTPAAPFGAPVNLGAPVDGPYADGFPSIAADGLSLYFVSDRPGGLGGDDLWVATRQTTAQPFSRVINLGPTVNSSATEWSPSISADGLDLFFASDRAGTLGVLDLWVTLRSSIASPFGQPIDLGPMVNSSADDAGPDLAPDGTMLYFMSRRPGGLGFYDLWAAPVEPHP